jgi:hypothetical protein
VESSPDSKYMRFLEILFDNNGKLVKYQDIAKHADLGCWNSDVNEKDLNRDVQLLKKAVRDHLASKVGMPLEDIDKMIRAQRNIGFKINR